MSELRDLYQQIILDHNRAPRNFKKLEDANRVAEGDNPLCGDKLRVYVQVSDEGVIDDIGFQGSGCAISKASASLMTSAVKGRTVQEAERLFGTFRDMVTGKAPETKEAGLGKLVAFAGVREFPARVKCASLSWHTLHAALEATAATVSTE
ncbi:MAG: SUF system NifU family Fe-S cluster assembly protein [Gemmatimonadetes bacterium]|nr:SUF system NifU family Fe-S cluster assembly protein [Gemmatimonadota bacterium]